MKSQIIRLRLKPIPGINLKAQVNALPIKLKMPVQVSKREVIMNLICNFVVTNLEDF